MGNSIKNVLGSVSNEKLNLMNESKHLISKWQKLGLLEGIEDKNQRAGMAILLENQTKQLLSEASSTGTQANSEEWSGVALPLVRRIFGEIAAQNFVSIQPMSLPSGLIFYLDFKYGTSQFGFEANTTPNSDQTDSLYGITNTSNDASQGLYGSGRYGYSVNDVSSSALSNQTSNGTAATTKYQSGSVAVADYNYNTLFSSSKAGLLETEFSTITVAAGTGDVLANADKDAAKAFHITGTGIVTYYPEFTKVSGDYITFLVSGSGGSFTNDVVIKYKTLPTDITRGDFEDGKTQENPIDIPEVNLEVSSIPIVAQTRKLKAVWSPEFAQDLNAYHVVNAEEELTSMLTEYIAHEIDLEILDMLDNNVKTVGYWSSQIGRVWNGTGFTDYSSVSAQAAAYNQQTWFQTLGTVLTNVSNTIHQKTLRGGANWAVVPPKIATIMESMNGFKSQNTQDATSASPFAFGVENIGSFSGKLQVYKNPYKFDNSILMGYRGAQFLETGAVYAPYIPLIMTPLIYDPNTFTPRKGVMTRYAKKVVRGEFFGKVYIDGLSQLGM